MEGIGPDHASGQKLRADGYGTVTDSSAPDPHPSTRSPAANWPAPLAEEAYYGLAGWIVRAIEPHTEADPAAILLQLLAAFGSAVGPKPHFIVEADRHGLNTFVVLVGQTSKGRKGSAWGRVERLLRDADPIWVSDHVKGGLSSGEGLIYAVRDPNNSGGVVDPGVTDKRLLDLESEFASTLRVIGREGNTLSATIRQAWDTGNLAVLTRNNPLRATGAHISIIGHVTRDELRRYLTRTETANGFANRFLWACTQRARILPEGGGEPEALDDLVIHLRAVVEDGRTIGEIGFDDEARAIWYAVYESLSEGKPGMFGAVISRAEAQTRRLAAVYTLLDGAEVTTAAHLLAGLAIWQYCEESARYIFGTVLGNPTADAIVRALAERGPLSQTDVGDLFGRHRGPDDIAEAQNLLEALGLVRVHREETGGRPRMMWELTGDSSLNSLVSLSGGTVDYLGLARKRLHALKAPDQDAT